MFDYSKIPDVKLTDIVTKVDKRLFLKMPKTLKEFCEAVDADDAFYPHHTNICMDSKTVRSFYSQIYKYLESLGAVSYSINDGITNACIVTPLAITYYARFKDSFNRVWKIKDIPELYKLGEGSLWLPPHHQASVTMRGKVPERVTMILRDYVKYVLKCPDKNQAELLIELNALAKAGVLDDEFFKEVSLDMVSFQNQQNNLSKQSQKGE